MVVKVKGSVSNGGGGTAERVEAQVEGAREGHYHERRCESFVVLGQTVIVDGQTSPISDFAAIVANTTVVEVHGLRDATGRVRDAARRRFDRSGKWNLHGGPARG